jgi:hypothetical protein
MGHLDSTMSDAPVSTVAPVSYSTEYDVPVDPMDDLQCESCQ